ncbi:MULTISPECIES: hypothetical protein [Nitrosomonas]|uniref:DUF883 domain-containing protein n=1 Tax=Nitrosomonas communis TaxID=44574 RepID=A0A0F7K9K7_9PROT|nr:MULTISPECIES: hypothetical protein [Nitrosomonas]AKH36930.1 hypothetical protein AAW31_02535 [Nitrosomonas communis]TYP86663.1 hypothetical protein BCL69_103043 [Nitrosomonas communis]UVS62055.1 DUF883 domain-containing protein [Nitrosomonas sp. PLL12]
MAMTDDFRKEMDQLKKEFSDLGSLVSSVKDIASKQSGRVVDLAEDTGESVEKYIKERPLTSALVIFGSGVLAGVLLSNSNKR